MATGVAAGFDIDKLLKSITNADKALSELMDKSNQTSRSLITSFQQIASQGVVPYTKNLEKQLSVYNALSSAITDSTGKAKQGYSGMKKEIDSVINSTKSLVNLLSQTSKYQSVYQSISKQTEKFYQMTGGRVWNVDANATLNAYKRGMPVDDYGQNVLAQERNYHDARQKMYEETFNKYFQLQEKEKQAYSDYLNYELQLLIENAQKQNQIAEQNKQNELKRISELQQAYEKLWRDLDVSKQTEKFYQMTGGRVWNVDANAVIQQNQKDLAERRQYIKERTEMYTRMFEEIERKERESRNRSRRDALRFADPTRQANAAYNRLYSEKGNRSEKNMEAVLQRLRDARSKINTATAQGRAEYDKMGKKIRVVEGGLKNLKNSTDGFKKNIKDTNNVVSQLGRTLTAAFSIRAIAGYAQSLARVRGEFELQHKALTALIQDQDKANELWNKTVALAVRSPYRVKELVTYTKQLSAYRVESDKLYDTTKMLADIASGLGVDMQRLILAYGQVKAANYLRGTELRQFSEAGINILGELSAYFTEIEGRAVSVGAVFERVSKRMVSFQDVDAVLKRVTSQGGQFYRMQDIQAQTLQGMMSNLKDSIDLMLNDIGEANEKALKGMIATARKAVENWREFITVIELAASSIATLGVVSIAKLSKGWMIAAAGHKGLAENIGGLIKKGAGLQSVFSKLWKTIAAHPFIAVGAAIGTATLALVNHYKAVKAANKAYDEASAIELRRMDNFEELTRKIEENNTAVKDAKNDQEKLANANKNLEENVKKLTKEYPDLTAFIKRNEDGTIDLTRAIEEQNEALRANIALQQQAKGSFWQQALSKNYSQALDAQGQVLSKTYTAKNAGSMMGVKLQKALNEGIITKDIYERFDEAFKKIRQSKNYEEVIENWNAINKMLTETPSVPVENIFDKYAPDVKSLEIAMTEYRRRLNDFFGNLDNQMDTYKIGIEDILADGGDEKQKEKAVGVWLKEQFSKLGIIDTEMQNEAARYISKQIGISPITLFDRDPSPAELDAWQKRVSEAVGKVNEKIKQAHPYLDEKELANMLIPLPQPSQMREQYMELVKEWLKVAQATYTKGQKVVEDGIVKQTKISAPFVSEVKDIFNIQENEGKGKKTFNEYVNDLVRGIVDARKEYVKWNKVVGATESQDRATRAFEGLVAESARYANMSDIGLANIDLSDENDVIVVLQDILRRLPQDAKDARIAVQKMISDIQGDSDFISAEGMTAKMIQGIENMFGQYELSLELEKLDFPPSLAQDLFGIETVDLSDIREKIESELQAARMAEGGQERIEKLEEQLTKVNEMEQKAQLERLKTYTKYLLEEQHERVKIEMETLRKIREVDELYNQGKYSDEQYNTIVGNIRKEGDKELAKQTWKSFESTDMYLSLFEDMDKMSKGALESMKSKLDAMRESLKQAGLPASDLKEILSQIEKIEEELESRNPWQGFAKNGKAVFSYAKKMRDLEKQRAQQQKILDGSSVNYANFSELLAKAEQDLNKIAKEKGVDSVEYNAQLSLVNNLSKSTNEYAQNMKDAESQIADTNREMSELTDSTLDFETQIRDIVDTTGQLANAVLNVVDSFNSLDETTKEIADETIKMAEELVNAGVAIGKIVASEGTDFKSWAQLAISVANMVASAFNIGDADKRKDVEKHQRSVEKLMKSYERLEGQISEAWNLQDIAAYNKEMQESLNNAIEAQKAAIEAQKARKGAGNENSEVAKELEAMEEELVDMESRLAEVTENTFSKLTAGIYDDIASTARAVTDAWYDSFAETGDGLKGLEENFKDTFLNIAKEQAALQITGAYVDQWKEALGNFINDDDKKLTPEEAAEWAEQVKSTFPQLSSALDAFLGTIHEGLGVTGGDGLTGLQKGIQGITAEQSDILAAHLNNIANVLMTNDTAFNPMLAELRGIQQYAKNMHEMMTRWDNGTNAMRVEVI